MINLSIGYVGNSIQYLYILNHHGGFPEEVHGQPTVLQFEILKTKKKMLAILIFLLSPPCHDLPD